MICWTNRETAFKNNPTGTLGFVGFFNDGKVIQSVNQEVLRQVALSKGAWDRVAFVKFAQNFPVHAYNVASGRLDTGYMRHRRVLNPAFNDNLYRHVWEETVLAFDGLRETAKWSERDVLVLPDLIDLMSAVTLFIIAKVGFGVDLPWDDSTKGGEAMVLRESFEVISKNFIWRGLLPEWMFRLPIEGLKKIKFAGDYLLDDLRAKIKTRRAATKDMAADYSSPEDHDIFGRLLIASDAEVQGQRLDDDELASNTFIMLFAGHETSSKALSITLGLLACHPEEQEKLYQVVKDVVPEDRAAAFEDYESLSPLRNAILEALRLYPVAPILFREAYEDTTLIVPGLPEPLVVEKGTIFIGDYIGVGWDPTRYPSPSVFIPSRWTSYDVLAADSYVSFGMGIHTCIGRRFALYEMVCYLALFLREWRVFPGDLKEGETLSAWRKRVMEDDLGLAVTIAPQRVPVKLERR
ncbi:cytochrome P450 [Calocera viscosa TUFC12733]|uniref:Cytochrome P450 n=1 Tax=Calocera viscosa (strain TUFC12733) TaxID=1330018 RepID=A0A167Q130_CALVF|nr:cytochrome P450 [Calocera viscosa TUFC12733]